MTALRLIEAAADAGLTIRVRDDRLVIRGPRSATDLVQQLLAHKAEVIAALCSVCHNPVGTAAQAGGFTTHPGCDTDADTADRHRAYLGLMQGDRA
ncbi:hypothetical protein [Actinoplanes sp. NPDC051859]|uniref:hypothetical protein n=1 Tax=Actinoplanes sp. NPDC051859 TaxID=3363909 RepID=UPI0037B3875F